MRSEQRSHLLKQFGEGEAGALQLKLAALNAGHVEHITDQIAQVGPELRISSTRWRSSSPSDLAASKSAIPSTPVRGVRSSWLIAARKSLLALLACSATSLAARRSAACRSRSATSRKLAANAASRWISSV